PEGGRKIEAVTKLESMDEAAGDLVISHRSPRPPIGRRIRDRLHRQDSAARIVGKGDAQALAIGWRNERQSRPAGRAQAPRLGDRIATRRAQRRQCGVESESAGGPKYIENVPRAFRWFPGR